MITKKGDGLVPRWFTNPDAVAALGDGAEWAPWLCYTRTQPPADWEDTGSVAAYTPEESTRCSAVHEAGHAVLLMSAGCEIGSIRIERDPAGFGQARTEHRDASCLLADWVAALAAGERAEVRWMVEVGIWTSGRAWVAERHAWRDRCAAGEAHYESLGVPLVFHGAPNDPADYAWFCDRADESLDGLWGRVLGLAEQLVESRYLSGEEVARLAGLAP